MKLSKYDHHPKAGEFQSHPATPPPGTGRGGGGNNQILLAWMPGGFIHYMKCGDSDPGLGFL